MRRNVGKFEVWEDEDGVLSVEGYGSISAVRCLFRTCASLMRGVSFNYVIKRYKKEIPEDGKKIK